MSFPRGKDYLKTINLQAGIYSKIIIELLFKAYLMQVINSEIDSRLNVKYVR